jgi:GAF domain-containing protein
MALEAGFQSVSALPLRLRTVTVGALNLFHVGLAPMDERDIVVAQAFADLATISLLQYRATTEAQRLNEQLSAALSNRVLIEQAKGVIAERAGVDPAEAFSRLRAYARNHNLLLTNVAQAAVDGTLEHSAWEPGPQL